MIKFLFHYISVQCSKFSHGTTAENYENGTVIHKIQLCVLDIFQSTVTKEVKNLRRKQHSTCHAETKQQTSHLMPPLRQSLSRSLLLS